MISASGKNQIGLLYLPLQHSQHLGPRFVKDSHHSSHPLHVAVNNYDTPAVQAEAHLQVCKSTIRV